MHSPIETFLNSNEGAANVLGHARLLFQLNQRYQELVPHGLSCSSRVANLKSGLIIIHADNGVVASKLRQMSARLQKGLCLGAEFSGVEVKVQPQNPYRTGPEPRIKPLSHGAESAIQGVRRQLPKDSPLGRALDQLLARAAKAE